MDSRILFYHAIRTWALVYSIKYRPGQVMYEANTGHTEQFINSPQADDEYGFLIAFPANYGVGSYPVVIALHDRGTHLTANLELRNMALVLKGVNTDKIHIFGYNWLQMAATGWSQR